MTTRDMTKQEMIETLMQDVVLARQQADAHRQQHQNIIRHQEILDGLVKEADEALRVYLAEQDISYVEDDQIEAEVKPQDRGQYDAEKLPPHIRDNPEITHLTVDRKALDKAIKGQRISKEEASAAWVPKLTKPILYLRFKEPDHE